MIRTVAAAMTGAILLALPSAGETQVVPKIQRSLPTPLPQVEPLRDRLRKTIDETDETVEGTAGDAADDAVTELDAAAAALQDTADNVADTAAGVVGQADEVVTDAAQQALRVFELDAAADGWPAEARTIVAIVSDAELERIDSIGLDVISRRSLPALGGTLVTFREPTAAPLETTLATVRSALPDSPADLNHVYRTQRQTGLDPAAPDAQDGAAEEASRHGSAITIGLIDSAVDDTHFSLDGTAVRQRSFVTHEGSEPTSHGTAVASLLARAAGGEAAVLAASVFFQTPNYAPGASTESLVAALDWLASNRVDAINMSLAGPPNDLLEGVIRALGQTGPVIVAAVGNNGPNGEPMYPAAYDGVIGVTAVDRERVAWLYANRGDYVDFAAPGVNVKVADAGAGWRIESGTSMAAPVIAVAAATVVAGESVAAGDVVHRLSVGAEDLGRKGHDTVYGFGYLSRPPVLLSDRADAP